MTDVATGWSERVAVLGRSAVVMQAAFQRILTRLPFPILELHPDNGSEFLNYHLLTFFKQAVKGVQITRSRPWQKNDNPHVEQRNDSLVRAYLGYDRLDSVAQAQAANQLYDQMWLYWSTCASKPIRATCTARSTRSWTMSWRCQPPIARRTSTPPWRPWRNPCPGRWARCLSRNQRADGQVDNGPSDGSCPLAHSPYDDDDCANPKERRDQVTLSSEPTITPR
jgi:hypothetical protein